MTACFIAFILIISTAVVQAAPGAEAGPLWQDPNRGAKVDQLAPGRGLPKLTAETLFADWTHEQVARWHRDNPPSAPEEAYQRYAATAPTDAALTADFPRHIAPFARVRSGSPDEEARKGALIRYCPFCRSRSFSLAYDPDNEYRAVTNCCRTELYGREEDYPADYPLRANDTVRFLRLDDTFIEVPCTVYRDADGVEWELFLRTIFDQRRWLQIGSTLVVQFSEKFRETADPLYAHKIAVILDEVAETYYGLPLCHENELAVGRDEQPLTRAEWEAVPRPAIFEVSYLGGWNRRTPIFNKGWINMSGEHIWVEPFARVRHHPAFKYYSQRTYGDPEALDRKIMTRLLREVALMFKSVFSQKLLTNYQEANYVRLWLLGVLLDDATLIDFAGPAQEVAMYNHTYQDGLNGEGAPNYMAMPGGYFYPYLRDPAGWLEFYPDFLEEHPFYFAANDEMRKLTTVRGLQVEFGDQHQYAFPANLITNPQRVRDNEQIGSRNWPGYGVGIMRLGGPGLRQELCLTYTRATLHNAQDALGLDCWVDGIPVMRRGGYAAWWCNAPLQWERPEFAALAEMDYPREIAQAPRESGSWSWAYAHSAVSQNNLTVDERGVGLGWGDNRGYGEVVTFKGGEAAGDPGSGFQVLDVKDHYSWERVDRRMEDFRRTLIGVEGPDGRPYVVDITKAAGEGRQALYNSAWAEAVDLKLPPAKERAETLEALLLGENPEGPQTEERKSFRQVRNIEVLEEPHEPWELTWKNDAGLYAPRDPHGGPLRRPWEDDTGQVRLRFIGLPHGDGQTELIRAQGPWIGWLRQPLPGGQLVDGNVAFVDARDFLIEHRRPAPGQVEVDSLFVHILEGFRETQESAILAVERLAATSRSGDERDIVALELQMAGGHTDTVIYQSAAGVVALPDGSETDARYALLRRDAAGQVMTAEVVRGSYVHSESFSVNTTGDYTGTIVDVVGDLTGTRKESALVIRPTDPWPEGDSLHDRQLLIRFASDLRRDGNEGYRVDTITHLPDGLVRIDLQDYAPFITSWHEVTVLPEDRPNVIRTWRPMVSHANNPWYRGMKLWFPARDKHYTISSVNPLGGGFGGDTVELVEDVNLAAEGISVGDWYVIYGVYPGLEVTVPNDLCFRRERDDHWLQYTLRSTGPAEVQMPADAAPLSYRSGDGPWKESDGALTALSAGNTLIIAGQPHWLDLEDNEPPRVVSLSIDGRDLSVEEAADLGWIEPPQQLVLEIKDDANPLDDDALQVRFNNSPLPPELFTRTAADEGRSLTLEIDLHGALEAAGPRLRRHQLQMSTADMAVRRHTLQMALSFMVRTEEDKDAVYLSDLTPVDAFAHGGLKKDQDYTGNPCYILDNFYLKCLTLCPGVHPDGAHGRVVFELPGEIANPVLLTDIGISNSSGGRGSVVFMVQTGQQPDGPWETVYTSRVLRGGEEPLSLEIPLTGVRYLRLFTNDAGDGINSDHAVWGGTRLVPQE